MNLATGVQIGHASVVQTVLLAERRWRAEMISVLNNDASRFYMSGADDTLSDDPETGTSPDALR
jgi:hypothetical protein